MLAYRSTNGRYFAGKQITCEFVSVTKWKVAICGEFMRSKLVTCSRGTACNFIHCFRNPGGDYEWANWDKPPPKYWIKEMSALFGYSYDESIYDRKVEEDFEHSADVYRQHSERYHGRESRRSRSRENKSLRSHDKEHDARRREQRSQPNCHVGERCEEDTKSRSNQHHHRHHKSSSYDGEPDRYCSGDRDGLNHSEATRKRSRHTLSEKTQTKVFKSSSSSSDSEQQTQSKDHHDNIVYSKRRRVERWDEEKNTDERWDKRKDSRHQATKRRSSRYLSDDNSSPNDAKRSDEDFGSDCGYESRSSHGTRHHSTGEKADETVRWEPEKEVTGDYHGKHLESGKKSHRSHHRSRNHKGKS
ncbi:unnamed protein product [Cuscuta campestris]|uniref:C3H1-type domain-containing protein n=1 Tax=Cuscuta campestris TaxID=132261 RepID=A0A484LS27_9ASTE|nr:unnamed protein product [Cuscuta campestris]